MPVVLLAQQLQPSRSEWMRDFKSLIHSFIHYNVALSGSQGENQLLIHTHDETNTLAHYSIIHESYVIWSKIHSQLPERSSNFLWVAKFRIDGDYARGKAQTGTILAKSQWRHSLMTSVSSGENNRLLLVAKTKAEKLLIAKSVCCLLPVYQWLFKFKGFLMILLYQENEPLGLGQLPDLCNTSKSIKQG